MSKHRKLHPTYVSIVVLIIAALAILVAVLAWRMLDRQSGSASRDQSTIRETDTNRETEEDASEAGYSGEYIDAGDFQVKAPGGWSVQLGDNPNQRDSRIVIFSGPNRLETLVYDAQKSPTITEDPGYGWGGPVEQFVILSGITSERSTDGYTMEQFVLDDGTKGQKFTKTYANEPGDGTVPGFQKTSPEFHASLYRFEKNGKPIWVDLNVYSSTVFDRELAEQVIRSIQIR